MSCRPALSLSLLLSLLHSVLVPSAATAQTGELYWAPARHRFETEQGLAERRPLSLGAPACPSIGPPCAETEPPGSTFYYLAQYAARARLYDIQPSPDAEGRLALDLQLAWRVGANAEGAMFGSMLVGGSVAWIAPSYVARAGLGVGAPLWAMLDATPWGLEVGYLLAPYGHGEPWLARRGVPFVLQLSFEAREDWFFAGVEVAGAIVLGPWDAHLMAQAAAFVGGRPVEELALGVRVLGVVEHVRTSGGTDEEGFVSITPFVRLDTRPVFAELRWTLSLDEPYGAGIGRDPLSFWSLRALLGWETD